MITLIATSQPGASAVQPANTAHWVAPPTSPRFPNDVEITMSIGAVSLMLLGCLIARVARRRRMGDVPLCPGCDHDLRGYEILPERCPECGGPMDPRVVARRRSQARRGLRRSVRVLGRTMLAAGVGIALLLAWNHPMRLAVTPTSWLLTIDAAMVKASPWLDRSPLPRVPVLDASLLSERWCAAIVDRGRDGSISDQELSDLARRLLDWYASGRPLSAHEREILAVAYRSDNLMIDRLAASGMVQPPTTPGAGSGRTLGRDRQESRWVIDRIPLRQHVNASQGDLAGIIRTQDPSPLVATFEVLSVTVGDVSFPVEDQSMELPWSNWKAAIAHDFIVAPPDDVILPKGRHTLGWTLRRRVIWNTAPDGPRVLSSTITTETSPRDVTIAAVPPIDCSGEAGEELRRRFAENGVIETNPEGALARLIVDLGSIRRAEIAPAALTLTVDSISSGDGPTTRFEYPKEPVIDVLPGTVNAARTDAASDPRYVRVLSRTLPNVLRVGDHVTIGFDSTACSEREYRRLFESFLGSDEAFAGLCGSIPSIRVGRFEVEIPVVPLGSHARR